MIKVKRAILGIVAAAAIAVLPMAPAMANGHGFRPAHGFGVGHGLLGAAVALATLPLVVASNVLAGVSESAAPVAYAPARPYYAPHAGYYAAPGAVYGPRPYYRGHPGYDGRGYYRSGGYTYPRR
jgi:hypothetical protein